MSDSTCSAMNLVLQMVEKSAGDLPEEAWGVATPGHGHTPFWIVGHLALVAEMGLGFFGVELQHPRWLPRFGPGSRGDAIPGAEETPAAMIQQILELYPIVAEKTAAADAEFLAKPHGFALLESSPVKTVGDLLCHLMTTHLAFHASQLSASRRQAGFAPFI